MVRRGTPLLATGGEINAFEKWNGALIRSAGPRLCYLTTHLVADLEETLNRSADRDTVIAADLALPVGVGRAIGGIRRQIEADPGTRGHVKLAYTEWMFRSPPGAHLPDFDNMGGAVIAAAWLNMLARNADWIPIANMTGLMEFGGIHKRHGRTYVTPQFWSLYLFSKYAGDTVIGTETRVGQYDVHGGVPFAPEIPGVPYLDVLGTVGAASGDVSLFVVNRNPKEPQPASIRLKGFRAKSSVHVFTLAAPSLLARNDEEHQAAVQPVESRETLEGDTLRHTLPAASLTLFLFSAAS
jgi:alpha-N-arabinofuranosidase